jgi:hypothetical protein
VDSTIIDEGGILIVRKLINGRYSKINLSNLANGHYIIQLDSGEQIITK